jgi:hypothetical protein
VLAGAVVGGEVRRAHRLRNRRGNLVRADRPRATKLLAGQVDVGVDGLGVLLRAEGLVSPVAGQRQRSLPKAA